MSSTVRTTDVEEKYSDDVSPYPDDIFQQWYEVPLNNPSNTTSTNGSSIPIQSHDSNSDENIVLNTSTTIASIPTPLLNSATTSSLIPLQQQLQSQQQQQQQQQQPADSKNNTILVSNRIIQWNIKHVQTISNFITQLEIETLHHELIIHTDQIVVPTTTTNGNSNSNSSTSKTTTYWEGFDGPRRFVRYYDVSDQSVTTTSSATTTTTISTSIVGGGDGTTSTSTSSMIPTMLLEWKHRLYVMTGCIATHIKIEEYVPLIRYQQNNNNKKNAVVNNSDDDSTNNNNSDTWKYDPNMICTFPFQCDSNNNNNNKDTSYFIAEIPITTTPPTTSGSDLNIPLIQNWNQPMQSNTPTHNDTTNMKSHTNNQDDTNHGSHTHNSNNNNNVLPPAMRWKLQSEHHMTYVHVPYNTLIIRQNDMCTQWRNSRYMYAMNNNSNNNINHNNTKSKDCIPPIRVIQFFNFDTKSKSHPLTTINTEVTNDNGVITPKDHDTNDNANTNSSSNGDTFGYVPTNIDEITERTRRWKFNNENQNSLPAIWDLVTILITTSPIKSNPSTDVIEQAMNTFLIGGGPTFAYQCRKIIVCDGYRTITTDDTEEGDDNVNDNNEQSDNITTHDDGNNNKTEHMDQIDTEPKDVNSKNKVNRVSRRHCNDKQSMRNGIVTEQQAQNYCEYKQNLHRLCQNATTESVFRNTQIVELSTRHGYGYAVRHVLRNTDHVQTPYVCVIQHDRTFMRPTPIKETLHAMWEHSNIKYVGFSMRSNLMYRDIYIAKYGKGTEYDDMILYPSQLQVSSSQYGPNSASTNALSVNNERVKQNICALAETYKGSAQATIERKVAASHTSLSSDDENHESVHPPSTTAQHQMSLVPTLYWYDNVHICETRHYRDFVFHPSYKMVAKGGFIEDKLSPILKRTVERLGLRDGHSRFGCFLLDDHSGMFFTGHIDGGSYISPEERKALLVSQLHKRDDKSASVTCD